MPTPATPATDRRGQAMQYTAAFVYPSIISTSQPFDLAAEQPEKGCRMHYAADEVLQRFNTASE